MLNAMREGAKSGISKFILFGFMVMAVGGLVFMDIGGFFRGGVTKSAVAKIGKQELPIQVFDRTLRRVLANQGLDVQTAYRLGLVNQVLANEISNNLVQRNAVDLGLEVNNDIVVKQINDLIEPLVTEEMTKKQALSIVLRNQGITERGFVDMIKAEMTNTLLRNALQIGTELKPERLGADLYLYENEKRDMKAVFLPYANIKNVETPSDDILLPFYQAGMERYAIPETRSFSVATLSQDKLAATLDVSDEELKEIYERDIAAYTLPERRVLQQAVFDDAVKADAVAALVKEGKSLKDAVKQETGSEEALLGEETFEKEGLLEEIGDLAFEAKIGDVIGPVETALGYHVLKLQKVVAPETESFASVKADLKKEIIQLRLVDEMFAMANSIDDSLAGGMSLDEVAEQMDLDIKKYGPVTADGATKDNKDGLKSFGPDWGYVIETSFDLLEGEVSPVIELADGKYAAIRLDEINERTYKSFEEVKPDLAKVWMQDQREVETKLNAQEAMKALNNGEKSLAEVATANGVAPKNYNLVRAKEAEKPFNQAAKTLFFALPEGEYGMSRVEDGIIIAQVASVSLPDASKASDADLEKLVDQAGRATQQELMQQYFAYLQTEYRVKINQRLLESTYGPGSEQF